MGFADTTLITNLGLVTGAESLDLNLLNIECFGSSLATGFGSDLTGVNFSLDADFADEGVGVVDDAASLAGTGVVDGLAVTVGLEADFEGGGGRDGRAVGGAGRGGGPFLGVSISDFGSDADVVVANERSWSEEGFEDSVESTVF